MCNRENREKAMEVVERDANGVPTIWCDPCIYRLVKALNDGGLRTIASCCGHGEKAGVISLADGRELLILPDYETTRLAERAIGPLTANTRVDPKSGV